MNNVREHPHIEYQPSWCGKSHKSEMIHDKLDPSMNDPMLIILSLDVAESPINQAFSNRSAVPTNCKEKIHSLQKCTSTTCHSEPRFISFLPHIYQYESFSQHPAGSNVCGTFISAPQNSEAASVKWGWGGVGSDAGEGFGDPFCVPFIY